MKIELRNLSVAARLSEETTAYTATIYIDGIATFSASNHGTGGCDFYQPLPTARVTEAEVNAWIAANTPKVELGHGLGAVSNDLELTVSTLIATTDMAKRLRRSMSGQIWFTAPTAKGLRNYNFKSVPKGPVRISAEQKARAQIAATYPVHLILNDLSDDVALVAAYEAAFASPVEAVADAAAQDAA